MTKRWLIVAPLTVVLILSWTAIAQMRLDGMRSKTFEEELLYLPNEKLLNHLTVGMGSVIADLLWLRCIDYTVKEFHSESRKFTWLEHMCNTITDLDPHFVGAYQYGGALLAAISADRPAMKLLREGIVNNPTTEELPFEAAKIYVLNRREEIGSQALAAHFLTMAAEHSDTPELYTTWADNILVGRNLLNVGREIWQSVLDTSDDKFMRELAEKKICELDIRINVNQLNELAEAFKAQHLRPPTAFSEFVQVGSTEDALGGRFFLDSQGVVQNTTLLDDLVARVGQILSASVKKFHKEQGRYPIDLQELARQKYIKGVPTHPYEEKQWRFDRATGQVQ